ncbi:hypothetical protein J2792_000507 [Novosphingobium capsulatum]|uniref:Uncharacterized protein n=1 Tax=Novosphingobium capsulatum TaxID=13688 RepID=A0ABU1MH93_9SPHN|nr:MULTISPECIES: hypothetical protein [Novosphingobium]MBB3357835.1 hypothetical protein [Novosphingobium sp. BK256]MBB3373501.1 hypothetical protein [Novosphingobium sp. BK280]MBB3377913.1 hypothetical protein [Novosphingobium sp. BK258]MBB3420302.1 hypothetical protein [Novosphingobium sp. BK267]MBB3447376.1 hypothetical protein [Novosphingobium sp. BK352]
MTWNINFLHPGKAVKCVITSLVLSIPLWTGSLVVAKLVIVPEVRAIAAQWSGDARALVPESERRAEQDTQPLLIASQHEAHVMADALRRI